MTVEQFVDMVQERLAGGDVSNDIRKLYKRVNIKALLAMIFKQIQQNDFTAGQNAFLPYDLTVSLSGTKYISTISVKPLGGILGIKFIESDCCQFFPRTSMDQSVLLGRIKNTDRAAFYYNQGQILWTEKPVCNNADMTTGTAYVIPDILSMADTDELVVPKYEMAFYGQIIQMMLLPGSKMHEIINNTKQDVVQ